MGLVEKYCEAVTIAIIDNCFDFIPKMIDAICPK